MSKVSVGANMQNVVLSVDMHSTDKTVSDQRESAYMPKAIIGWNKTLIQRIMEGSSAALKAVAFSLTMSFSAISGATVDSPNQNNPFERTVVSIEVKGDNTLRLALSDSQLSIRALNDSSFEVFYEPHGVKQLPSFALDDAKFDVKSEQTKTQEPVKTSYTEGEGYVLFSAPSIQAKINLNPVRVSFYRDDKLLVEEEVGLFAHDGLRGFRFKLNDDEKVMGGGQRVLGMDRRGQRMPLYNKAHYGYTTESSQMYYGLPAVMSTELYAIGFDNSASGNLDIGHTEPDILQFDAVAGRTSYIISSGETYADLVSNFVEVTGKQPLPPRWALGNYASRFGYKSQQQALDTIEKFESEDFPVDAIVLDLYWFGPDIKGHMGNLEWDQNTFPEPEKMINTLNKKGVKTIMITEPFILSTSKQWDSAVQNKALATNLSGEPRRFDFYFGNTGLVDIFDEGAQDWFWRFYEALDEQGVAGWWGDLGEPEVHPADSIHRLNGELVTAEEIHNVYGHKWAQTVYEKQRALTPNERPFIMMRSGFLGTQRYGIIPWTGDVSREWGGLQSQVELSLQMGLFGLAYTHSDLGGFAGGEVFDPELYIRWMQYGVFQPVYRPHAQDNIAPEPVFHDEKTKDIVREFVKLRYRLLPYNYSLSYENSIAGTPMMRPTFFNSASAAIDNKESYFWGDAFLVHPITAPDVASVDFALPPGVWFDYWNDKKWVNTSPNPKSIELATSLTTIPVMVKAGSFVPMTSNMQNTTEYDQNKLTVHYYHDASVKRASYTMYDDDGKSANAISEGNFQRLVFSSLLEGKQDDEVLALRVNVQGSFDGAPKRRQMTVVTHGVEDKPQAVEVNGRILELLSAKAFVKAKVGAFWNEKTKQLRVKGQLETDLLISIK